MADAIRNLLAADATISGLLTGGLYTRDTAGRDGLSRASTPTAYDAGGFLRPCALVRVTDVEARGAYDDAGAVLAARFTVEITFVADGDAAYSTLDAARARAYTLLHAQTIADAGLARWRADSVTRDSRLGGALAFVATYRVDAARG